MRQTAKWDKHGIGLILANLAMIAFLLIAQQVMGGSYYYQIREKFAGSVLDSGRVFLFTGADSTSTKLLTLSGDATAIDSVVDSILVTDTAACRLVYKLHFFGQGAEGFSENIPPMFPHVSGGAVDSNRTEQGGAGSGTYMVDWYVMDTLGGATTSVQGAKITIKNWSLDNVLRTVETDENGIGRVQLDADSIAAIVTAPLYLFPTIYDSIKYTTDTSDTIYGYLNVPAAAAGAHYVTIYLDVTGGMVDSTTGDVIPRDRIEFTLIPHFVPGSYIGDWLIAPKTQKKRPNSAGRVSFTIIANTPAQPPGSYYSLIWSAKDGRSTHSGTFTSFIVDTLVDPISILDITTTD